MPIDFDALMAQANQEKAQAVKRRIALVTAGCSTYALKLMGPHEVILCLCCGMWSPHPEDIAQRFCDFCHAFHSEWKKTREPQQDTRIPTCRWCGQPRAAHPQEEEL